jgi:hypothetical protein
VAAEDSTTFNQEGGSVHTETAQADNNVEGG